MAATRGSPVGSSQSRSLDEPWKISVRHCTLRFKVECFYGGGKECPEVAKRGLGDTHPTPRASGPWEWKRNSQDLGPPGRGWLAPKPGKLGLMSRAGAGVIKSRSHPRSQNVLCFLKRRPCRPCSWSAHSQSRSRIKPTTHVSFFHNIFHNDTP